MASTQREAALVRLLDTVTAVAVSGDDLGEAARTVLDAVREATGWPLGHLCVPADDGGDFVSSGLWAGPIEDFPALHEISAVTRFAPGVDIVGRVVATGQPVWSHDVTADAVFVRARRGRPPEVRAAFAVPIVAADGVAAVLEFFSVRSAAPDELLLRVMASLGHQLGRIVDRRNVQVTVQAGRDRLRQVIDTSVEGFVSTDATGRITEWNAAAARMFGRSRAQVLGRLVHEAIVPERYRSADQAGRARFLATGKSNVLGRRLELAGARPDGSEFPIEIVVWATHEDGTWAFHAFIHDITDRHHAQQALRQAYEAEQATVARLKELDTVKDAFLATVSHELRTPLASMIGYLEVVTDAEAGVVQASPPGRKMLEAMIRNTVRLQHLVEDLLAINTLSADRLDITAVPVPVGEVVEQAVRVTGVGARDSGHSFRVLVDPGLAPLAGDRDLLVRAVGALLSNAVKFSAAGTPITVHASADGPKATITVIDHGAGIDADELAHVFERFYRTRYAEDNAIQGIGLGLAITKAIAEAHGGTVTAATIPGRGSTFTLTLPIWTSGPDADRPDPLPDGTDPRHG
ncbi:ATP-binding protein [Planobispora siamensis]|uniref:histidine kinase n=1 Tax=Planobispora siamensis TaxID=936338 RepID=A0A8J3WQN1_9ACTN|nr:ATP-binding protein [Planobispora siamensis]GIH95971.1 hypothetical protein Psi01_66010 [Planobispora siamensis]